MKNLKQIHVASGRSWCSPAQPEHHDKYMHIVLVHTILTPPPRPKTKKVYVYVEFLRSQTNHANRQSESNSIKSRQI